MPPGKPHEDAIIIIQSTLKEEFYLDDSDFIKNESGFFRGLFPDLAFRIPKSKDWIVIEVGNTSAEKIEKYLSMSWIAQVRWYTKLDHKKGIKLVGQWFHGDHRGTRVKPESCKKLFDEKQLSDELEYLKRKHMEMGLFEDSYVCCSGCGEHIQVKHIRVIDHCHRQYAVCPDCKEKGNFNTINSFRDGVYQYLNQQRKRYDEIFTSNNTPVQP
jgi:hypothetical protein